ncbi:MAG: 2-dehydropantoate 2-reductase, partial [Alphaproteobacteria bacterium]|nr:2-dehydropantoate 2-reductase [Alphaproteobacteria bacterium]
MAGLRGGADMAVEKKNVTIMGAGGMGALFGAILADGGLDVALVDTDREHIDAINRDGLKIQGFGGDRTRPICATTDAGKIERADIVLFQCKAHGAGAAAEAAKHLIDGGGVAISFQNGLGNEEVLADALGEAHVLGGLTTMAGWKLGPGVVKDFSRTPSWIGEMGGGVSERAQSIAAALSNAGLETKASDDIVKDIWKKLLGNIAMSAVSGITDLTSAEALAVPELKRISMQALDEAWAVAIAAGIEIDRVAALSGLEAIFAKGGTGDNKSSLCVDLLNRRPTEVDVIYGSVIEKGDALGVPTPTLNLLASLIKGL